MASLTVDDRKNAPAAERPPEVKSSSEIQSTFALAPAPLPSLPGLLGRSCEPEKNPLHGN